MVISAVKATIYMYVIVLKEIVQEERWYLDVLYGSKISMEAMHTLVGCLFLSALMLSVTIISYMLLVSTIPYS